jgi:F-type H+-transporting ATPase subunit delta
MSTRVISRRYAQALMNLAAKDKQVEAVATGLDEIAATVRDSSPLSAALADPKVPHTVKVAVIGEVLDRSKVPALVATFLRFLAQKRRVALLEEIRQVYHELADERLGRGLAEVTVANPLDDAKRDALRQHLEALSGKSLSLRVQVDAAILGGVVARIGSTVWDGSLRNQLTQIRQSLIKG